jgi:hypothetical protein
MEPDEAGRHVEARIADRLCADRRVPSSGTNRPIFASPPRSTMSTGLIDGAAS